MTRRPPNIVVFLADDLGYGDVGCYNKEQLYNLAADPQELRNVWRDHPGVVAELGARLDEIRGGSRTRPR